MRHLGKRGYLIILLASFFLFTGIFFVWVSTFKIPALESFSERAIVESTKIYDRTGETLLYDVNQNLKRTVIPFEEISRHIKNATIAIEDQEFYQHNGIKPTSFLRAILINTTSFEFSQGGSTITQQVVKNSLLSSEKKISRKIKEWVLALKLEKVLNKEEILAAYLNEIPYGGSLYGVEEASQAFFGRGAREVSLAEAAYLAALPKAPTYYSPYGNNREKLEERKNLVLSEMFQNGFINEKELETAKAEEVVFKPREINSLKAPHFVFFVLEYLEKKYGKDAVERGGLRVKTTLDYSIQEKAEKIARTYALENKDKFNAENAAFVAEDPRTGEILLLVGSRDYFDEEIDGNFNIATSPNRQPGSTFKPFVYAQAFMRGYTPETVVFDVKTQFSTYCAVENRTSEGDCYSPENYDSKYRGPVSFREALAQSINIPSVKVLYLAGIKNSIDLSRRMGITTLSNSDQYGLTLVLGGGEVSLIDMVSAYGVFANEGIRNPYVAILEVRDRSGKLLEEFEQKPQKILEPEIALTLSDILSDNEARAPSFGQTSFLHIPDRDVAVKTGTTNDYRDAWIIGYTPSVVLGAWAGNNNNSPMEKRVAGFIVAPMWRALMDEILARLPDERFPEIAANSSLDLPPVLRGGWQGGVSSFVDSISGKVATEYTPRESLKEYLSGGIHSILHWIDKNDPLGPRVSLPTEDPQYAFWEYAVNKWVSETGITPPLETTPPQGFDDVHIPENFPHISLLSPSPDSVFSLDERISISVSTSGRYSALRVEYFVNDFLVGDSRPPSFSFSFLPSDVPVIQGENILKAVITDSVYNKAEARVFFQIF